MDEKLLGEIKRLFVTTEESREIKESLDIDLDGVYEDKFKGKDLQRSILLVSTKSYELAKQNGIDIADGDLGENILVDFDPYLLESGTKLQVGDVILEICQKSTLCKGLTKLNSKLPKLLKDRRGIFAKAISSGQIKKDDCINLL